LSNNKKRLAFKGGFTLIELIVTIGILVIVLATAYPMGNFGSKSFNNGSAKSDVQSNTRLAANYITKELRYSSNATILTTLPALEDRIGKYIYVENGILMQYDKGKNLNTSIVGDTSNRISILNFEIKSSKTVYFNVQGAYKNQTFKLESTILLLNIGNNILINGPGTVNTPRTVLSYN